MQILSSDVDKLRILLVTFYQYILWFLFFDSRRSWDVTSSTSKLIKTRLWSSKLLLLKY
jgi:hypothetical protein